MKIERDERRFDFHDIGLAIKRAREASGMTQEQLAYIVDRSPRTIMYNENDGQHPSLNTFYQLVTMFDISVDQYFYPSKNTESSCRKRINARRPRPPAYPRPPPYRCWRRWPQGCCFPRTPSRTYTIAGSAPPAGSPAQAASPRDAA